MKRHESMVMVIGGLVIFLAIFADLLIGTLKLAALWKWVFE